MTSLSKSSHTSFLKHLPSWPLLAGSPGPAFSSLKAGLIQEDRCSRQMPGATESSVFHPLFGRCQRGPHSTLFIDSLNKKLSVYRVPAQQILPCCSVPKSCPSLELQHTRLLCPPVSPRVCSNSCPLIHWCYLTISCSAGPFSFFCPPSFPASGSFPVSQLFPSGGQNIWASASASVLPMNIQGWVPLGWTVRSPCYYGCCFPTPLPLGHGERSVRYS